VFAFHKIFNYIDVVGPLIGIITFLFTRKKISPDLKLVFGFCAIQFVCNVTASTLSSYSQPNYWVYKINTVASFVMILLLFSRHLLKAGKKMNLLMYAFVILIVLPTFFGEGLTSYNSYSAAISSLIIVGLCLYFFYTKLVRSSPEVSLPSMAIFWCVVGFFVYYAGAFFIFLSYKYLIETDIKSVGTLWKFHNLLLLIACLSISYGVVCKNYQQAS